MKDGDFAPGVRETFLLRKKAPRMLRGADDWSRRRRCALVLREFSRHSTMVSNCARTRFARREGVRVVLRPGSPRICCRCYACPVTVRTRGPPGAIRPNVPDSDTRPSGRYSTTPNFPFSGDRPRKFARKMQIYGADPDPFPQSGSAPNLLLQEILHRRELP